MSIQLCDSLFALFRLLSEDLRARSAAWIWSAGFYGESAALSGSTESELWGLCSCKQMVWAVMTSFWSQPDRDSGCRLRFPSSAEVRPLKWSKNANLNKGLGPISREKEVFRYFQLCCEEWQAVIQNLMVLYVSSVMCVLLLILLPSMFKLTQNIYSEKKKLNSWILIQRTVQKRTERSDQNYSKIFPFKRYFTSYVVDNIYIKQKCFSVIVKKVDKCKCSLIELNGLAT